MDSIEFMDGEVVTVPLTGASLDDALAEAEAALPEGAWIGSLHPEDEFTISEYAGPLKGPNRFMFAAIRRVDEMNAEYVEVGYGPTLASALHDLATRLKG